MYVDSLKPSYLPSPYLHQQRTGVPYKRAVPSLQGYLGPSQKEQTRRLAILR